MSDEEFSGALANERGTVKIDKYVILTEKSPKIIIFDNELQRNICSINTLDADDNVALAQILLDELNTGAYEPVEDVPVENGSVDDVDDDSPSMNSDGELNDGE
jgi:hypothetical protein